MPDNLAGERRYNKSLFTLLDKPILLQREMTARWRAAISCVMSV